MILNALHPAPVLRVPARMRSDRLGWSRTLTPVEIREVSAGELEPVPGLPVEDPLDGTPLPLSMHDGSLWTPIATGDGNLAVDELSAILDGSATVEGNRRITIAMRQLARSPLCIPYRDTPKNVYGEAPNDRGDVLGAVRIVRRDGTDNAAAAMRAFAAEDLLLADGVPHVRVVPLARVFRSVANVQVRVLTHRGTAGMTTVLASPATLDAMVRAVAIPGREDIWSPPGLDAWRGLPESVFGDRAATYAANEYPGHIRRSIDTDARLDLDPSWRVLMAEREVAGLARGIQGPSVADTLQDCAAALDAMSHRSTPDGGRVRHRNEAHEIAIAAIRDVYLPGLSPKAEQTGDTPQEDLDAFAGFGPLRSPAPRIQPSDRRGDSMPGTDDSHLPTATFAVLAEERMGARTLMDRFDRMPLYARGGQDFFDASGTLRALGFEVGKVHFDKLGRNGRPMFVSVVPPDGWTIEPGPDAVESIVRDALGRERALVRYKASAHDRNAHVQFLARHHVHARHGTASDGSGRETSTWVVMDRETGEASFTAETLPEFGTVDGAEAEALPARWASERQRCRQWISDNAPDTAPDAYWTPEDAASPSP